MPDPASPATDLPALTLAGDDAVAFDEAVARARDERWAERLFDRDATLWSSDERVQEAIGDRLGWLDAPDTFAARIPAIEGFARGIREAGFTTAVVMGMGGSSLAPDVLARTFGTARGWLDVRVLDSTDPDAVGAALDDLDPLATLHVVASKSGTTTEPLAFLAEAWARIERELERRRVRGRPGDYVVAVTDPGRSATAITHHDELRELFLNPPDIGGRYSALTYVGLVPGALQGLDLDAFLAPAGAMLHRCRQPEPSRNPGLSLGLAIGGLARAGRDKLTFLPDPEIATFGAWAEQLIAESTGKHGVGIVPVDLEPVGRPLAYGDDRIFVRIALAGSVGSPHADALVDAVADTGHPVIRIHVADPMELGAEFVRWEVATAIAGAVLGIDPFDQPNVEEAKELTRKLLAGHAAVDRPEPDDPGGRGAASDVEVPAPTIVDGLAAEDGLVLIGDAPLRLTAGDRTVVGELRRHVQRTHPDGYLALQAFIAPAPARDRGLSRIRALLRDRTGLATTAGYGPRYLHSTGQLHKGGPPTGWFLQITADHPHDREIPGWPHTFGQLIDAQAEGDLGAIESHDRPILRVHLRQDPDAGLATLERALAEALGGRPED